MSEKDKAWHQALTLVMVGLDPGGPLPSGLTERHLISLERLAGQARWRLKGQQLREQSGDRKAGR